jgi:hypothetical protein
MALRFLRDNKFSGINEYTGRKNMTFIFKKVYKYRLKKFKS